MLAVLFSFGLARVEADWIVLWPSCVALILVFVTRSALAGLLLGALCGAILLADGALSGVIPQLFYEQLVPFALLAAGVAGVCGFLPLGFGLSPWICLVAGSILLFTLPDFYRSIFRSKKQ